MGKDFRVLKTPESHKNHSYLNKSLVEPSWTTNAASSLQYLSGRAL